MKEYSYIKLEDGHIKHLPTQDPNGEILVGRHMLNLTEWMDENPEERKRLGWIKHIHVDTKEIEYNRQSQYLQHYYRQIDEFTIKDEYEIIDKSEEMMLLEELSEGANLGVAGGIVFVGMEGEF